MRKRKYFIINFLLPIIVGAAIYYIIAPDVAFVQRLDALVGNRIHMDGIKLNNSLIRFIRFYSLDMMWGYALTFALSFFIGSKLADLIKTLAIAFVFSVIVEVLQMVPILSGTFDVWDIITESFAEILAVIIITIHKHGWEDPRNEKKN